MSQRSGRLVVALVLAGLSFASACGSSSDGTTASDAAPDVPGSDAALDSSGDSSLDAALDSSGDSSLDAPLDVSEASEGEASPFVDDIPSQQKVTLHVTNGSGETRYLVTAGALCTPYQIEKSAGNAWQPLPIQVEITSPASACGMGTDYNGTGPSELRTLAPGEQLDLVWDARAYVFGSQTFLCSGFGQFPYAAPQPVAAGTYRATIGAMATPLGTCTATGSVWHCSTGFDFPQGFDPMCMAPITASAEFQLTSGVDAVVNVTLP